MHEHLFLEDLDTRNTGEDFQEQAVQSIKNALLAAYELGRLPRNKKGRRRPFCLIVADNQLAAGFLRFVAADGIGKFQSEDIERLEQFAYVGVVID